MHLYIMTWAWQVCFLYILNQISSFHFLGMNFAQFSVLFTFTLYSLLQVLVFLSFYLWNFQLAFFNVSHLSYTLFTAVLLIMSFYLYYTLIIIYNDMSFFLIYFALKCILTSFIVWFKLYRVLTIIVYLCKSKILKEKLQLSLEFTILIAVFQNS